MRYLLLFLISFTAQAAVPSISCTASRTTGVGGALTIRHATVTASTYDAYGNYLVTLDTTDTNTLGPFRVQFAAAASCAPVWQDFTVVPANVYDSLVAGSAELLVEIDKINNVTITGNGSTTPFNV